jgi:hypothetical protein
MFEISQRSRCSVANFSVSSSTISECPFDTALSRSSIVSLIAFLRLSTESKPQGSSSSVTESVESADGRFKMIMKYDLVTHETKRDFVE